MRPGHDNDIPAPSTIRIGRASVGLVGLEPAFDKILRRGEITEEEAVDLLYAAVSSQNYVPADAAGLYRKALRREYRRRLGRETGRDNVLTIRVLGTGCVSCNKLSALLIAALTKFDLAADMESVHDPDEIWRYGVTRTPALVINGKIKCAGRMPSPSEVERWVREAENGSGG